MLIDRNLYRDLVQQLEAAGARLIAVSKTKPVAAIRELYDVGQRDFGENYVQELTGKQQELPRDIRWHFIGHLQTNKVKYLAPFVHLIHGIDSFRLLKEVSRQAERHRRTMDVLLQVHIAVEETKFGFGEGELDELMTAWEKEPLPFVRIRGLMGMASFSPDEQLLRQEFRSLKRMFDRYKSRLPDFSVLSMGMSGDYRVALEEGSNMVRIGSLLFGERGKTES